MKRLMHAAVVALALPLGACAWFSAGPEDAPAAAVDAEQAQACADRSCRGKTVVKLQLASGELLQRQFDWFNPVIQDNSISILAGEELFIEADEQDGRLVNLKQVPENAHPEKTLVFKFWQDPGHVDMTLAVSNPFSRPLKYRLSLMDTQSSELKPVSSCSVLGGGAAYEYWPKPIVQLLVVEPVLLPASAPHTCE